jgi:hypothetical protein
MIRNDCEGKKRGTRKEGRKSIALGKQLSNGRRAGAFHGYQGKVLNPSMAWAAATFNIHLHNR